MNKEILQVRVPIPLKRVLSRHCIENDISMSQFVRECIEAGISKITPTVIDNQSLQVGDRIWIDTEATNRKAQGGDPNVNPNLVFSSGWPQIVKAVVEDNSVERKKLAVEFNGRWLISYDPNILVIIAKDCSKDRDCAWGEQV